MLQITEIFKYDIIFCYVMTTPEEHKKAFQQFMEDINEKIRMSLLVERQKIIGFAASEAATNLLEYFLHKKELVTSGFRVNHRYFTSIRKAEEYIPFDFPQKKEILMLLLHQERSRDLLCYGKEKQQDKVEEAITNLQNLKKLIEVELGENL